MCLFNTFDRGVKSGEQHLTLVVYPFHVGFCSCQVVAINSTTPNMKICQCLISPRWSGNEWIPKDESNSSLTGELHGSSSPQSWSKKTMKLSNPGVHDHKRPPKKDAFLVQIMVAKQVDLGISRSRWKLVSELMSFSARSSKGHLKPSFLDLPSGPATGTIMYHLSLTNDQTRHPC